jgi:outer membrane biosynthesis protein TonB
VLGSILTRQYRFATRGIEISLRTAQQAIDIAGGVAGEIAGRLGLGDGRVHDHDHDDRDHFDTDVMPEPAPEAPSARETPPAPEAPPAPREPRPAPEAPPAPEATAPTSAPAPPVPPVPSEPTAAEPLPPEPAPPEPAPAEPAHVSTEPELVRESAEPGAEDGAGAQIRIDEPWPGYRSLKARDIVARLPTATREELATVELFERAGANRSSVIVAAQRALKKASPPR